LRTKPPREDRELLDVFWASQDSTAAHHDLDKPSWQLRLGLVPDLVATERVRLLLRAQLALIVMSSSPRLRLGALEARSRALPG